MARGRGKFFGLWLMLIGATLYFPFQEFLQSSEYTSSEEFFEDLLMWVIAAGVVIVPIVCFFGFRGKKSSSETTVGERKDSPAR